MKSGPGASFTGAGLLVGSGIPELPDPPPSYAAGRDGVPRTFDGMGAQQVTPALRPFLGPRCALVPRSFSKGIAHVRTALTAEFFVGHRWVPFVAGSVPACGKFVHGKA